MDDHLVDHDSKNINLTSITRIEFYFLLKNFATDSLNRSLEEELLSNLASFTFER